MVELDTASPVAKWMRLLPETPTGPIADDDERWSFFWDDPIGRTLHSAETNLWEIIWRETQTNLGRTPSWIVLHPRLTMEIAALASGETVARSLSQHTLGSFTPTISTTEFEAAFHRSSHSRLEVPVSDPSTFNARQFASVFWLSARSAAMLDPASCAACFHVSACMARTLAEATLMDVLDFVNAGSIEHKFKLSYEGDIAYQRLIAGCAGGLDRAFGRMMASLQGLMSSNLSAVSVAQSHGRRG